MSSGPDAATTSKRDRNEVVWVGLGIIVLGLALMPVERRWAYNFQLVEYDRHFWMTLVMVFLGTVVAAEAVWHFVWRRSCRFSVVVGVVAIIATYRVFYPIANGALDRKPAEQRVYVIAGRFCGPTRRDGGRATVLLQPLDPADRRFRLHVPRRFCRAAQDGQELYVDVKAGFLNTGWVSHYDVTRNVEKDVEPD